MATIEPDNACLDERAEAIRSRMDLAGFARDLMLDLRANPEAWENHTLDAYLEALAAWLEDAEGYYKNRGESAPSEPKWRHFGEALLAAKVYE